MIVLSMVRHVKLCGKDIMLNPIEVIYDGYIYDYKLKNVTFRNKLRIPPKFGKAKINRIRKVAWHCHQLTECNFYSRTDMKISNDKITVLEINGEPVLSKNDFVSRSAKSLGITYPKLIIGLLCNNREFMNYANFENPQLKKFINRIAKLITAF